MGVEDDDMVSNGRRFSVCEGSAVVGACAEEAPDAGMSSSQGGSGRGSGIYDCVLMKRDESLCKREVEGTCFVGSLFRNRPNT